MERVAGACTTPCACARWRCGCLTRRNTHALPASLIGATPQLKHPEIVTDTETDRCELQAGTRGVVHLEVQVLAKGFAGHGVSFNDTPSSSVGRRSVD